MNQLRNRLDTIGLDNGNVTFCTGFTVDYDVEETHDAAWDCLIEVQEFLNSIGLHSSDMGSDNDSVFGTIEKKI